MLAVGLAALVLSYPILTGRQNVEDLAIGDAKDGAMAIALACEAAHKEGTNVQELEIVALVRAYPSRFRLNSKSYSASDFSIKSYAVDPTDGSFRGQILVEPDESGWLKYQPPTVLFDFARHEGGIGIEVTVIEH